MQGSGGKVGEHAGEGGGKGGQAERREHVNDEVYCWREVERVGRERGESRGGDGSKS